jgi:hypothetical protein
MNSTVTIRLMLLALGMTSLLAACGGQSGTAKLQSSIQGSWTIYTTSAQGDATLQVTLIPGDCSDTPDFQDLTACFEAGEGIGSISGTGYFLYPPAQVILGVNSSDGLQVLLTEGAPDGAQGDSAVFVGSGTVSNGAMSGAFQCDTGSTACSGISGTFSGSKN